MKLLLFISTCFLLANPLWAKKFDPPVRDVEEAIKIAKDQLRNSEKVVVKDYIIQRVEFLNIYNEYEAAHWNVRWERVPRAKGGWFEIKIYNNGEIETFYGE